MSCRSSPDMGHAMHPEHREPRINPVIIIAKK